VILSTRFGKDAQKCRYPLDWYRRTEVQFVSREEGL
jgi:hypothetical protein